MPKKARTPNQRTSPAPKECASPTEAGPREREALRIISEGVCVPVDLLARYLGATPASTKALAERLQSLGWARSRTFLSGESPWLWLTRPGARLADTGLQAKAIEPAIRSLPHRRAILEVRLSMEASHPGGCWVPESRLYAEREGGCRIPDGVFELKGRREAIEVELSPKSPQRIERVLCEHSSRYDAVIYYAGRRTRAQLQGLEKSGRWPSLIVRDAPGFSPPGKRVRRCPKRDPEPWEIELLALICEQGAIPIDQLARFTRRSESATLKVVGELCRQSYVRCEELLADEPQWVWCKHAGARFSGTSLSWLRPRIGGLPLMRAANEVRLQVGREKTGFDWISKRRLARELGQYAVLPDAALRHLGRTQAILIRFNNRAFPVLERRLATIDRFFDSVLCYCADQTVLDRLEQLSNESFSGRVGVRHLPK